MYNLLEYKAIIQRHDEFYGNSTEMNQIVLWIIT